MSAPPPPSVTAAGVPPLPDRAAMVSIPGLQHSKVQVPATGLIAITPVRLEYDRMAAGDIVVVDAEGRRVEGERQPSSETDVHLVVHRRRPDVNAVVHTEPVYSSVFGVLGQPIEAVLINMVIYSRSPVPVMPFMPGSSTEFGEAMVKVRGTRNAVIWGNHGLMTVGADLTSAFRCNVAVETSARVQHAALCLGQPSSQPCRAPPALRALTSQSA